MRVSLILLAKAVDVSVVRLELNLAETSNTRNIVSGSTITGVIEATVNGDKSWTNRSFSAWGLRLPVVVLIDMKPFPNYWVETTPNDESKEPLSPPKTETAWVFGKNLFTNVL